MGGGHGRDSGLSPSPILGQMAPGVPGSSCFQHRRRVLPPRVRDEVGVQGGKPLAQGLAADLRLTSSPGTDHKDTLCPAHVPRPSTRWTSRGPGAGGVPLGTVSVVQKGSVPMLTLCPPRAQPPRLPSPFAAPHTHLNHSTYSLVAHCSWGAPLP